MNDILEEFINNVEGLFQLDKFGIDGFSNEFQKIKHQSLNYKQTYPATAGEKTENRKKNRYKDILPFDYTRVTLPSTNANDFDYINASFLKGPNDVPSYIASQGPLPQTVDDFWKMVWSYKVYVVIMVCRREEQGKRKCEKYWSDDKNDVQVFGEISVTLESCVTQNSAFLHRILNVRKGDESRLIHQFHYKRWPDHGCPQTREHILSLIKAAREEQDYSADAKTPLLVHCSAGCGRTGVVVVIDFFRNLLLHKNLTSNLSVFDVVCKFRQQRPAIVQTKDQYEFVNVAVSDLFAQYSKSHGISLTSCFSKSLVSTNYENVTLQEKPSSAKEKPCPPSKPAKVIAEESKSSERKVESNYENIFLHETPSSKPLHKNKLSSTDWEKLPSKPPLKPNRANPESCNKSAFHNEPGRGQHPLVQSSPIKPKLPKKITDIKPARNLDKPTNKLEHSTKQSENKQSYSSLSSRPTSFKKPKTLLKPRHLDTNQNSRTASSSPTTVQPSFVHNSDIVVTESLQARKERLWSHGMQASSSGLQKKPDISASISDLRSIDNLRTNLLPQKLQRTSSMDNAINISSSNASTPVYTSATEMQKSNKDTPRNLKKPPLLPKKTYSLRFQSAPIKIIEKSDTGASTVVFKKDKKVGSDELNKGYAKYDEVPSHFQSGGSNQPSSNKTSINTSQYDNLRHSTKVNVAAKKNVFYPLNSESYSSKSNRATRQYETISSSSATSSQPSSSLLSFHLPSNTVTDSSLSNRQVHLYSSVPEENVVQQKDDATTAFAKKPTLPIKPKRASMSNKAVANPLNYVSETKSAESQAASQYSMADNDEFQLSDLYSFVSPAKKSNANPHNYSSDPMYSSIGSSNTVHQDAIKSSKDSNYSHLHNSVSGQLPRSTSNSSLNSTSQHSSNQEAAPPVIPTRTPESLELLPSVNMPPRTPDSQIPISGESTPELTPESPKLVSPKGHSDYEEVKFDVKPSNDNRRTSGATVGMPLVAGVRGVIDKTKKQALNVFQQLGNSTSKGEDSQVQHNRTTIPPYSQEPVVFRNQDISYPNRLNRKPKGPRDMPEKTKRKMFAKK